MLTTRIVPCLDVRDGRVVKGVKFQGLRDAGDPVERARAYEALNFPAVLDGGAELAANIARWKEQHVDDATIDGYIGRVLSVDVAAVQAAASRLVDPARVVIVVVGDAAVVGAGLERFGAVRRIAIDDLLPLPAASPSP